MRPHQPLLRCAACRALAPQDDASGLLAAPLAAWPSPTTPRWTGPQRAPVSQLCPSVSPPPHNRPARSTLFLGRGTLSAPAGETMKTKTRVRSGGGFWGD